MCLLDACTCIQNTHIYACFVRISMRVLYAYLWSALDHIALTYNDVTVFAIPEFKSLKVLEKKYFCTNIIVNQPQN